MDNRGIHSVRTLMNITAWLSYRGLPIILAAAVVQGWSLYGLHHAIEAKHWPANEPPWLFALYAIAVFIPVMLQFLARYAAARATWIIIALVTITLFYFGWHTGSSVMDPSDERFLRSGEWFPLAFALAIWGLMLLPFIQARLLQGSWRVRYGLLFDSAWNNKLVLAEAALFTGLFWLLLMLWAQLFEMLGIGFFEELFEEPIFIYPVISLVFGGALHLIGSIERLTTVILEQLLNVLKWLALLAGLILALFTVALAFKLPGMLASGERVIGAAYLLWLIAVTVLLVNAAFRDGSNPAPYPKWLAIALRWVVPLTVVISFTALYALYLRIETYGLTVERVWACIVATAAAIYSVGYALACRRSTPWMAGVAHVNVIVACFLLTVIALALTPVLSPHRLAANSQYARVLDQPLGDAQVSNDAYLTALRYLHRDAGAYGRKRLEQLAALQDHPLAEHIRADAAAVLKVEQFATLPTRVDAQLAKIVMFPSDRAIDPALRSQLETDMQNPSLAWHYAANGTLIGAYLDLNGDGSQEFAVIADHKAVIYELEGEGWRRAANFSATNSLDLAALTSAAKEGKVSSEASKWRELRIGNVVFRLSEGQ
jgi:hypothetical protein